MSKGRTLIERFEGFLPLSMDTHGIFPLPGMAFNKKDEMDMLSLDLNPEEAIMKMLTLKIEQDWKEFIFGIDRTTKPNSFGIPLHWENVLTIIHYTDTEDGNGKFSYGVYAYNNQNDHDVIRWDNEQWNAIIEREFHQAKLSLIKIVKDEMLRRQGNN